MIVVYTKLYSHREKADISFKINNKKIRLFLRMLLLSGYNKLPDHKMYGRHPPILLCKQGDSMSRNTFEHIFWNLHLCDKKQLAK